jgi:hypothetical protein
MRYFYGSALFLSCIGFALSLIVHIRAFFGFGIDFLHTLIPFFALIFVLTVISTIARKKLATVSDPLRVGARVGRWGPPDLLKDLPNWAKWANYSIFGYFILVGANLFVRTHPSDPYSNSGQFVPPAVTLFFSSGLMSFFSIFIFRFWQATKLDRA